MPASEVSEQISLAGTEASGTGNMKFMLNGAITLGTLDGANVEIADAAGIENEIIFGMLTEEVNALKRMGYHPSSFINDDDVAMAVLDLLEKGWNGEDFHEIANNLRNCDPYMVMADFQGLPPGPGEGAALYADRETWNRMSLMQHRGQRHLLGRPRGDGLRPQHLAHQPGEISARAAWHFATRPLRAQRPPFLAARPDVPAPFAQIGKERS